MKTEIRNIGNRLYHVTIENTDNCFFRKVTLHEFTEDGIKYKGKVIVNDVDAGIDYLANNKKRR